MGNHAATLGKNLLLIFILIFGNSALAQENQIDSLMAEGNTAFTASDFQTFRLLKKNMHQSLKSTPQREMPYSL